MRKNARLPNGKICFLRVVSSSLGSMRRDRCCTGWKPGPSEHTPTRLYLAVCQGTSQFLCINRAWHAAPNAFLINSETNCSCHPIAQDQILANRVSSRSPFLKHPSPVMASSKPCSSLKCANARANVRGRREVGTRCPCNWKMLERQQALLLRC